MAIFSLIIEHQPGKVWKRMSIEEGLRIMAEALAETDNDPQAASQALLRELEALNRRA
jgi:hypothetical protein